MRHPGYRRAVHDRDRLPAALRDMVARFEGCTMTAGGKAVIEQARDAIAAAEA